MKRVFFFFAAAAACMALMFAASGAIAGPGWHTNFYIKHSPPTQHETPRPPVVVPPSHAATPPPGPSPWCKNHPKQCHPKKANDPAVNTPFERCLDSKGNNDGFISAWEMNQFKPMCK